MSTTSRIGRINLCGEIRTIFCNYDGDPATVGRLLLSHYSEEQKVMDLIMLGDIVYLGLEVGENLELFGDEIWDIPVDHEHKARVQCVGYNDRSDPNVHETLKKFSEKADLGGIDFVYLYWHEDWYIFDKNRVSLTLLTEGMCKRHAYDI